MFVSCILTVGWHASYENGAAEIQLLVLLISIYMCTFNMKQVVLFICLFLLVCFRLLCLKWWLEKLWRKHHSPADVCVCVCMCVLEKNCGQCIW